MGSLQLHVLLVACLFGHSGGCDTTFTSDYGEIHSPKMRGSSKYPNNSRCCYTVKGSQYQNMVELTFVTFETEWCCDYLIINNQKFSGNLTGRKHLYPFIPTFKMQFTSDNRVSGIGFIIIYRLLSCPSEEYDDNCTVSCSDGCQQKTCTTLTPFCECKTGWNGHLCDECRGGQNCSSRCSSGCSDVCSKDTGRCTCRPGWTGETCDSACPSGSYDSYCTKSCSPGCVDGYCNKEDGSCSCRAGFTGTNCTQTCPPGSYDSYCTKSCSPGCVDGSCNMEDGSCSCREGFRGTNCSMTCPPGSYDSYCTKSCSPGCVDGSCNMEDGSCSCREGFRGTNCSMSTVTNVDVKLICVAAGGSAGLLLLVSAVVLVICYCRRRTIRKNELRVKSNTVDDIQLQNVQVPQLEDQDGNVYSNFDEAIYDIPIEEASSHLYSTAKKSDAEEPVPHASNSMDNHVVHVSYDIFERMGYVNDTTLTKARTVRSFDEKDEINRNEYNVSTDEADTIAYINDITVSDVYTYSDSEEWYDDLSFEEEEFS